MTDYQEVPVMTTLGVVIIDDGQRMTWLLLLPAACWLGLLPRAQGNNILNECTTIQGWGCQAPKEWSQGRWLMLFKVSPQLTWFKVEAVSFWCLQDHISQLQAPPSYGVIIILGGMETGSKERCHDRLHLCCSGRLVTVLTQSHQGRETASPRVASLQ